MYLLPGPSPGAKRKYSCMNLLCSLLSLLSSLFSLFSSPFCLLFTIFTLLSAILCVASLSHKSLMHVMSHASSSSVFHLSTQTFLAILSHQSAMQVMSHESPSSVFHLSPRSFFVRFKPQLYFRAAPEVTFVLLPCSQKLILMMALPFRWSARVTT